MKFIASLFVVADAAVVIYVEKVLMTPWTVGGHVVHAALKERVIVGLIVALPALAILLVAVLATALRGRSSSTTAASAPRPSYGSYRAGGRQL